MEDVKSYEALVRELEETKLQLNEAVETIEAIRHGQVDAFIVKDNGEHQLYTLKSADQTYRVFIENMNEGAVTLNRHGIILYANNSFANMVQCSLSQVIGKEFLSFVESDNVDEFRDLIGQGWQHDKKGEQYLKRKDGGAVPVLISMKTLELDSSIALSIILADLSNQKETEIQLKQHQQELLEANRVTAKLNNELEQKVNDRTKDLLLSRERFKFLADNIPVIVWTALPNGEMEYYNQRWYEYTGANYEESRGWGWQQMIHPDDAIECITAWAKSIETGTPYMQECRFLRASDGSYRWHYTNGLPFRNEQGEIVAWFGIITDIEEQKKAMQRKDDFISIVSHELKTPLTSIKAYIQLMKAHNAVSIPQQIALYINKADDNVKKLEFLINDLLDVSRVQTGKLEFNVTRISINEFVHSCVENAKILYPSFEFHVNDCENLYTEGNFERLEQVIMNLVNNAVKYSPSYNIIKLEIKPCSPMVRISVIDSGIGLTEDQKHRIFDRFYRVQNVSAFFGGLGMGLYISSEIIKQHNGTIGVESRLNEGSTFYFELPLVD